MTVRMQDSNPAEMAELDFSRLDMFHNPDADRHRAVWALIEVPTYSRRHSPTTLGHGSALVHLRVESFRQLVAAPNCPKSAPRDIEVRPLASYPVPHGLIPVPTGPVESQARGAAIGNNH